MISVIAAPSNLGLRPPEPGGVPGAAKAPEALREAGLFDRLIAAGARDGGVVLPGRYVDDDATRKGGHVRNQTPLIEHAVRLADRIEDAWRDGASPLVLGGDCSLLIAAGIATARRGRLGLVHLDGHTDFRHPGNNERCASLAGEDLAAAVGLHLPELTDIEGLAPYFEPARVAHAGHRPGDEHAREARAVLGHVVPAAQLSSEGTARSGEQIRAVAGASYWLQLDVDVLDPSVMPAVDSPDDGGIDTSELVALLRELAPHAVGASVTVFDPDLDPSGQYARLLVDVVAEGLGDLGATSPHT